MENTVPQTGRRVVIVGGGLGGLLAACFLAKKGFSVRVYETDTWLGGNWRTYQAGGHFFDAGPVWLEFAQWWQRIFAAIELPVEEKFLLRLDPAVAIRKENGRVYRWRIPRSVEHGKEETAFYQWVDKQGSLLMKRAQKSNGILSSVYSDSLPWMFRGLDVGISWQKRVEHYKESNNNIYSLWSLLAELHLMDIRSVPAAAAGWWSEACHGGIFYPAGGFSVLIRLLEQKARELGAEIVTGVKVYNIGVRDGVAHKVTVEGEEVPADIVISNAGYRYTETGLLGPADRQFGDDEWESVRYRHLLRVFVGVNGTLENLHHKNVFYQEEKPVIVTVPSRTDPTLAPDGSETMVIHTFLEEPLSDSVSLREAAAKLVAEAGAALQIPDWDKRVLYQAGECVSLESDPGRTYRRPLRSTKVSNLYFVGNDLLLGGDELSSLLSASAVAQEIAGPDPALNLINQPSK